MCCVLVGDRRVVSFERHVISLASASLLLVSLPGLSLSSSIWLDFVFPDTVSQPAHTHWTRVILQVVSRASGSNLSQQSLQPRSPRFPNNPYLIPADTGALSACGSGTCYTRAYNGRSCWQLVGRIMQFPRTPARAVYRLFDTKLALLSPVAALRGGGSGGGGFHSRFEYCPA